MIQNVIAENPDDRIMRRAASLLESGALVALPTDTSWSVTCSIASREGIEKLKRLAGSSKDKPPTIICSELRHVTELCEVSTAAFRLIKSCVPGPYVFILRSSNRAARDFGLKRSELGVRIPASPLAIALVKSLALPLLSVTAKRTMLGPVEEDPEFPEELLFVSGWELEDIPGVALVLDDGEERSRNRATVLDFRAEVPALIRAGVGRYP